MRTKGGTKKVTLISPCMLLKIPRFGDCHHFESRGLSSLCHIRAVALNTDILLTWGSSYIPTHIA